MKIFRSYLSFSDYTRPGRKLKELLGVVMHWTGTPGNDAEATRYWFNERRKGLLGTGSAHYIIGQKGDIVQCIPEDEVAYHCGSSQKDPASKKVYTDKAREMFGEYAINYAHNSPNNCTIGIEMCPINMDGTFSDATIDSAVELVADILKRNNLTTDKIVTHNEVVGWKDCPRAWVRNPMLLDEFKARVKERLNG